MSDTVRFQSIGIIRIQHTCPRTPPIQSCYAPDSSGRLELLPKLAERLNDLKDYSHIYLIYHHHRTEKKGLTNKPYLLDEMCGVFPTHSP